MVNYAIHLIKSLNSKIMMKMSIAIVILPISYQLCNYNVF